MPKFVKTSPPIQIVYKTMSGRGFSTYDLKNWVKYDDGDNIRPATYNNPYLLEITRQPKEPVSGEFLIEFKLKTDAIVNLTIIDMQGRIIKTASERIRV